MRLFTKKILLITLFIVIISGVFLILKINTPSKQMVIFEYKNIEEISIYDPDSTTGDGDKKLIKILGASDKSTELQENRRYVIEFRARTGYANGQTELYLSEKEEKVSLDPYYSESRLQELLEPELLVIQQAIRNKYTNAGLYEIQPGKLYEWGGGWYGTTLTYIGNDTFNDDKLRVVLKKENGAWVIKTNPPYISLDRIAYPDVPEHILKDVNNL